MKRDKNTGEISRRGFLKTLGASAFAATTALYGCKDNHNTVSAQGGMVGEVPTDRMTYRIHPRTGDKVSLF